MSTSTDWLNVMLAASAVPLGSMVAAVLWKLQAKLGMQTTAQDKANMTEEIQASIGAGFAIVAETAPQIIADGLTTPKARADVIDAAARYFRQRFPDRTAQISKAAGGAIATEDVHAAVQQTIAARLTNVMPLVALTADPGGTLQTGVSLATSTLAGEPPKPALTS